MSINSAIREAIEPLVPVCVPDLYDGEAKEYCTFNYSEIPALNTDDAPQMLRYLVQVHWFSPPGTNPLTKKRDIRRALFCAGFSYPETENASEQQWQHYVFECEYMEGLDDGTHQD